MLHTLEIITTFKMPIQLVMLLLISSAFGEKKMNPLNGKHLRVLAMEFPVTIMLQRNSTNHIVNFNGTLKHHIIELSAMFNFSYSFLPVIAPVMENTSNARGGLSYLINNEADYILTEVLGTFPRFQVTDFPASWKTTQYSCIVPYPREKTDFTASLKPLSYVVWILIFSSGLTIVIYLRYLVNNVLELQNESTWSIIQFVLGNLVSQGHVSPSTRLAIRVATGVWCIGCFFLIQIYCCTLTSHLTSPNQRPIANSIQELIQTPSLSFTVDRGFGLDVTMQRAESGILRKLTEVLNKDPKLRCTTTADCLEIVRAGYAGHGSTITSLKVLMQNDLKNNGICRYFMMKDTFLSVYSYTLLQKNSPYTETISLGILRLRQAGFYDHWESWYLPTPWKCMEINRLDKIPRLSIDHLSSAFLILVTGYVLALMAFIYEKIKSLIIK